MDNLEGRERAASRLPAPILAEIVALIEAHKDDHVDYHHLRTRRAGSQKIIDFHLTICKDLSVEQAHEIADHIEKRIEEEIRGADVTIHIEPCREQNCPGRSHCPVAGRHALNRHDPRPSGD